MEGVVNTALQEFYRGKRVFVTGHTGFKGAWLCFWLTRLGAQVTGYALPPEETPHNLYTLLDLSRDMDSITGDIRDIALLQRTMRNAKPDIVMHLAAQALVLPSYEAPIDTYSTNIMGTINVLECVRHTDSIKAIVNITTDKCYENKETAVPFRESDPLGGHDPYSSSKAAAEIVSAAYRQSFLNAKNHYMATARAGNVIGGGDFGKHRLIPDIVRAVEAKVPVNIRHPDSIRPWQYVLDVLHGYLLLGKALFEQGEPFAQGFNFGPDEDNVTVADLTKRFCNALDTSIPVHLTAAQAHEARNLRLDNHKAKTTLHWRPMMDGSKAIDLTAKWYYHYLRERNTIGKFTASQLSAYERLIL
jgi:CDP-glucose 4,6-dehydratase